MSYGRVYVSWQPTLPFITRHKPTLLLFSTSFSSLYCSLPVCLVWSCLISQVFRRVAGYRCLYLYDSRLDVATLLQNFFPLVFISSPLHHLLPLSDLLSTVSFSPIIPPAASFPPASPLPYAATTTITTTITSQLLLVPASPASLRLSPCTLSPPLDPQTSPHPLLFLLLLLLLPLRNSLAESSRRLSHEYQPGSFTFTPPPLLVVLTRLAPNLVLPSASPPSSPFPLFPCCLAAFLEPLMLL
ncbi:hypothetical protein E2C01_040016 [Portunus trituberculatus]|uniref:Uncharacterized protein n=1 Tax=Portunus trituberculatus TaxID=210409 RepID=A0A5B7FFB3_PORTR|nr:hypothetical protein [Portunus trituberculatus]